MSSLLRKKSLSTMFAHSQKAGLNRSLSLFDLILLGVGCVIGSGT